MKRSSRADDLRKTFLIEEMSSISTLEVAWEHYPWGTYDEYWKKRWTKHISALEVAETNKLELLKWAREEKKCEWDDRTIEAAAEKVIWKW